MQTGGHGKITQEQQEQWSLTGWMHTRLKNRTEMRLDPGNERAKKEIHNSQKKTCSEEQEDTCTRM